MVAIDFLITAALICATSVSPADVLCFLKLQTVDEVLSYAAFAVQDTITLQCRVGLRLRHKKSKTCVEVFSQFRSHACINFVATPPTHK